MNAPEHVVHASVVAQMIPLAFIMPSPTNPRRHFDQAALDELTANVKKHGVIQPVLVRAGKSSKDPRVLWELVAGERRYRAAKAAGLDEIPATVRSLTDVEALELQVIENLQRADLHPLEEAEGYELLMKQHHYTAEDLAAKIGKSKAYVYARLKLCALTPKGREAFYAGELNPSTALLIARIPVPKLQDQALKEITNTQYRNDVMGVRAAAEHVREHYMLRLADAPFPPADAKLLPKAGACAGCPKRTGNQPELFGDVKGADVCTDPQCFDDKKAAHIARAAAAAKAAGQTVITGREAKKIAPHGNVEERSGYIGLDERNYHDPKNRTYRQLLGKDCPLPTLVENRDGMLLEVVAKKDVSELLKAKLPAQASMRNDSDRKREAKARLETQTRTAIFEAVATAHPGTMTPLDAALIAEALLERTDHECTKRVLKRWEPEAIAKSGESGIWGIKREFAKRIAAMTPVELVRLMVELALAGEIHVGAWQTVSKPTQLIATAERLGVDHAALRKQLTGAVKEKAKPKAAKKPAAKKAKTGAAKPARKPAAKAASTQPQEQA